MATRDEQESAHIPYLVPGTGWEAVIKDFVRSTYWSHQKGSSYWQQVYFSDNFSERKKLSCLHYGRTTVRLITWLIVARCSGQKGCSSRTSLSDFVYQRSLISSIIGFFNIHSKTFSRYDNLEVVWLLLAQGGDILETYPGGVGGGGTVTSYDSLYGEAPPKRNTFFGLHVYKRVGIY